MIDLLPFLFRRPTDPHDVNAAAATAILRGKLIRTGKAGPVQNEIDVPQADSCSAAATAGRTAGSSSCGSRRRRRGSSSRRRCRPVSPHADAEAATAAALASRHLPLSHAGDGDDVCADVRRIHELQQRRNKDTSNAAGPATSISLDEPAIQSWRFLGPTTASNSSS